MDKRIHSNCQRPLVVVFAAAFVSLGAGTAEAELSKWIKKNMADEHARCAAYFTIMSNVSDLSESVKSQYESAAIHALQLSIDYGSEKRTRASAELAADSMMRKMKEEDGLMLLMNEHSGFCKYLLERPEKHIEDLKRQE